MMARSRKVDIGTQWTSPDGRTWSVYELMPFGRAKVRTGFRFGEMRYSDILAAVAASAGQVPA